MTDPLPKFYLSIYDILLELRGTPQYNQALSEKSAEAVRKYLIREGGVDPARISSVRYRDLHPVALNQKPDGRDNPEGRAQNRRVEINILSD